MTTTIKEYLEQETQMITSMNRRPIGGYISMGEFILRNGRAFPFAPLPQGVRRGQAKMCYMNAAKLVMSNHRRFTYCEGYALGVIPVMHGWALDSDGNVVDPTWKEGTEYFGVPIKHSYVMHMMQLTRTYGVIDQWQAGWPILKDEPSMWRHPMMEGVTV